MQIHSFILGKGNKKESFRIATNESGKGVNKDITIKKQLPAILKHFKIPFTSVEHTGFRYYMDQCITNVVVHNGGTSTEARLISTKVTGTANIIEL